MQLAKDGLAVGTRAAGTAPSLLPCDTQPTPRSSTGHPLQLAGSVLGFFCLQAVVLLAVACFMDTCGGDSAIRTSPTPPTRPLNHLAPGAVTALGVAPSAPSSATDDAALARFFQETDLSPCGSPTCTSFVLDAPSGNLLERLGGRTCGDRIAELFQASLAPSTKHRIFLTSKAAYLGELQI